MIFFLFSSFFLTRRGEREREREGEGWGVWDDDNEKEIDNRRSFISFRLSQDKFQKNKMFLVSQSSIPISN